MRKPYLRASKVMQERVMNNEKIEVLFEHNAVGLFGENGVEGVHLVKRMGEADEERYDVAIDGFFLAIGHKPNSDIFKPYLDTDEVAGYAAHQGAGRVCRRRRGRPALPPGHHGSSQRLHGGYRGGTILATIKKSVSGGNH